MPTVNLDCGDQLIPADGVYVGRSTIDGTTLTAAVSIGNAPTFDDVQRQVEAHLIGFDGDLYGRTTQLEVIDWLRDQMRFGGIDQLKQQIALDIEESIERATCAGASRPEPFLVPA